MVENAFGVLAARRRVFHSKIPVDPQHFNKVVKATCVLHNMLQRQSTANQVQRFLEDAPNLANVEGMRPLPGVGYHSGLAAFAIRDTDKALFGPGRICTMAK